MNIIGHPYVAFKVFGRLTEDLALGMLCHGVKFGADKFSQDIEKQFEDKRGEFAKRIAEVGDNLGRLGVV